MSQSTISTAVSNFLGAKSSQDVRILLATQLRHSAHNISKVRDRHRPKYLSPGVNNIAPVHKLIRTSNSLAFLLEQEPERLILVSYDRVPGDATRSFDDQSKVVVRQAAQIERISNFFRERHEDQQGILSDWLQASTSGENGLKEFWKRQLTDLAVTEGEVERILGSAKD